ncbi:hypothetical protein TNCV_2704741 [Trichonephila clavipes]|nr:hypothetical protein TNCV_2704741 [Trichonephila clavipes]
MHSPRSLFGFDFVVFEGEEHDWARENEKLAGYYGSADVRLSLLRSQSLALCYISSLAASFVGVIALRFPSQPPERGMLRGLAVARSAVHFTYS